MSAPERLAKLRDLDFPSLAKTLEEDGCDVVRHEAAFVMAENYAHLRESVASLNQAALSDPSILVRHEACLALAKFPCEDSLLCLIDRCSDAAAEVRNSARFALLELLNRNPK